MRRMKLEGRVRVNTYAVIARAVEEGVATGWRRAHKHMDTPGEDVIKEQMETEVMNALVEVLDFVDEGEVEGAE